MFYATLVEFSPQISQTITWRVMQIGKALYKYLWDSLSKLVLEVGLIILLFCNLFVRHFMMGVFVKILKKERILTYMLATRTSQAEFKVRQ